MCVWCVYGVCMVCVCAMSAVFLSLYYCRSRVYQLILYCYNLTFDVVLPVADKPHNIYTNVIVLLITSIKLQL